MQISGKQLAELCRHGGALDGATVCAAQIYGENYSDGSADGGEIVLQTAGGLALLIFDALDTDGVTFRYVSGETLAADDARDRRRLADIEARAAAILAANPAAQALRAAALAGIFDS